MRWWVKKPTKRDNEARRGKKSMNKKIDSKTNKQRINGWQRIKKKRTTTLRKRQWQRPYLVFSFAERLVDDVDMLLWSPDHLPSCLCLSSSVFYLRHNFPLLGSDRQASIVLSLVEHTQADRQTGAGAGAGAERKILDFKCYVIALSFSIITLLNTKARQLEHIARPSFQSDHTCMLLGRHDFRALGGHILQTYA